MKAQVGAFNQEKALVGAFSVIVQLHRLLVYSTTGNGTRSSAEHRCRQLRKVAAVSARPRLVTTALGHRAARTQDNKFPCNCNCGRHRVAPRGNPIVVSSCDERDGGELGPGLRSPGTNIAQCQAAARC